MNGNNVVFTFTPLHVLNSYRYCDFTYRTYRYAPLYSILYMAYIPTIVMYWTLWKGAFCMMNILLTLVSLVLWAVQTESGCANIVTAAPCQSDPQQYETQYSRLRSFLSGITVTVCIYITVCCAVTLQKLPFKMFALCCFGKLDPSNHVLSHFWMLWWFFFFFYKYKTLRILFIL